MSPTKILETTIDRSFMRPDLVGGRGCVRCGEAVATYDAIATAAQGFARWLAGKGVRRHDRVALWLPNGLAWIVAHVGVAAAGAVCVPISTKLTTREASYILHHADVAAVVTVAEFLGRAYAVEAEQILQAAGSVSPIAVVDDENAQLPARSGADLFNSEPDGAAMLIYTSGTTGVPKGCLLSHRAWTNNARLSAETAQLSSTDVVYGPSPFFHLFGSLTSLMGAAETGAWFVTDPVFDVGITLERITAQRATRMVAVPTVWLDLMAVAEPGNLNSLRGGLWGGASFPAGALARAIDTFGLDLNPVYGMTEAPTISQGRPADTRQEKLTTVGQPTPMVEVRISSDNRADGDGEPVGEILVRGYNTMLGYFKEEAATAARWREGWLSTGDLGLVRPGGHLVAMGRITDMIISGGANIYAREIENVILEIPGVAMAAAVAKDDPRLGEVPVVWVVPERAAELDPAALLIRCRDQLAQYKVPRQVHFVDRLPLTASGKVHKAALREMANAKPAGEERR
jgi:acyl-CoA synthetase (AMP-forming)/AMP-acid ligase II